jgi:hypothetical protein
VLESQQSLRETLEKRSIPTYQNYSSHLWYRLLNQPVVESFPNRLRESPQLSSAK